MMKKKQAENLAVQLGLDPEKLVDIGDGWWTFIGAVPVSPGLARQWLDKWNTENRKPKSRNISRMSKDIASGMWHITHQGIAFRDDTSAPTLGDGQNRLMSIIRAGKTAKVRIFFGLTKEAMLAVDGGTPRSNLDSITLQGIETQNKCLATLRFFEGGRTGEDDLSAEQLMKLLETRQEELKFVFTHIASKKSGVTAGVRAAIMRAYYVHKNNKPIVAKLIQFCQCLSTGENISSKTLAKFHNDLIKQEYGGQGRKAVYQYTENVLHHFLFNPEGRFRKHDEELFPLESEEHGEKI